VVEHLQTIAELRQMDVTELAIELTRNTETLFNL
jgi:Tat protein secretion system quality control protein TatD with DNase activity